MLALHPSIGTLLAIPPAPTLGQGSLSGSAAGSLEPRELIKAQKALFEASIQLVSSAIDARGPYAGGHCARVPELTKMIARAASAETSGPSAEFMLDDLEWAAVHVAAWLPDCGKITAPEYVVEKATKLMSFMKKHQPIDPDLFDLFPRSGAYRQYAQRFMKPEQIDDVDLDKYLDLGKAMARPLRQPLPHPSSAWRTPP